MLDGRVQMAAVAAGLGVAGRFGPRRVTGLNPDTRLTPCLASVREPAHPAWGLSAPVVF